MPDGAGAHRVLLLAYGIFVLAASGRSVVQIAEHFDRAPLAYLLSAVAALTYVAGIVTVVLTRRSGRAVWWVFILELGGVVGVGLFSVLDPAAFPDATVWSHFGAGYGFVPLVLPVLGLVWAILSRRAARSGARLEPESAQLTPEVVR